MVPFSKGEIDSEQKAEKEEKGSWSFRTRNGSRREAGKYLTGLSPDERVAFSVPNYTDSNLKHAVLSHRWIFQCLVHAGSLLESQACKQKPR